MIKIFDFADKDKNGEISTTEINRYNGPVIVSSQSGGCYVIAPASIAPYIKEGDAISFDTDIEFYAGLTDKDIPEKGKTKFAEFDGDANKVLSVEEMENAVDKIMKEQELKEKEKEKAAQKKDDEGSFLDSIPSGLKVAGAAGWLFSRD